ncbi:MAG: YerC/YecD family TrpR-related protein [Ruthenibacterium sp.]
MAEKNSCRNKQTDTLFDAILQLKNKEECYEFFADLCTIKELADMAQRVQAANMLLAGKTYEQIVKNVEISTATISRINRCIQYGSGGYEKILKRAEQQQ